MTASIELPDAGSLFRRFYAPWYGPDLLPGQSPSLLSDLEEIELPPGLHIDRIHPLDPADRPHARIQIEDMAQAARQDWPLQLGVDGAPSAEWLATFDLFATPERIAQVIRTSDPALPGNTYLIWSLEAGVVTASVIQQLLPRLQWIPALPYWDSFLFDLNTMVRLNVLHWGVKRLSRDGAAHGLAEKVQAAVAFIRDTPHA